MEHVCPGGFSRHHRATLARRTIGGFSLPTPSPLVMPAHRMVFRSPTSSSPWAPRNLKLFGSPPAATPPLLLRPPHCPGASLPFLPAFAFLSSVRVVSQRYSWREKTEHPRWLLPEADRQQKCGWSLPMLGALTHGVSAVKGTEEIRTKHNILSLSSPITPQQCSEFCKKTHNNYRLHPPRSRFTARSLVLLLLGLLVCSVLDRPLSVPPAGKRSCSRREDWLPDTATLTDPHHVTALLVELIT